MLRSFALFLVSTFLLHSQSVFTPKRDSVRPPLPFMGRELRGDSVVSVIVEFREAPLYVAQQQQATAPITTEYSGRAAQFVKDLSAAVAVSSLMNAAPVRVRKEYYRIFFGVSAEMTYAQSVAAESLPYVRKVHRNKRMTASLHKSVPQIRADQAWSTYGVKGEGVKVGIIDSGIDYLHPALGGGIGPGFKVYGGYDFVNSDNDPMDDNGHGTHVAGIVAADGAGISGVAPKAKLYAFKVLGASGGGSEEDVIAAVERTVDPNMDGDLSDRLDVVNMSLGSNDGDEDDASSRAVDAASSFGVTFVIAAGNTGNSEIYQGKETNYYYTGMETIGSPGTARSAITVGAVDSLDKMAYFSSKGPLPGTYRIKPEVTAPGMAIRSLAPGGGFAIHNGTSMAAPMVAGVAALLKAAEPSLTPAQIKSRIVNASVDLGFRPMLQGAGRVDAMRAMAVRTIASPTVLSYGLDDPAMGVWTKVETVQVLNQRNVTQSYSTAFTGGAAGITLTASPSNFTLASGASQQLLVTISVNNATIPIVDEDIILYNGMLHVRSAADTLRLPWSFARTTRMVLSFGQPDPMFVASSATSYLTAHYNKMFSRVRWLNASTAEFTGPTREAYDFGVYYSSLGSLVLKSGVSFTGAQTFTFNAADAVHTVHFDGVDHTGAPFGASPKVRRSMRVDMPNGYMFVPVRAGTKSITVSPAGAQFRFLPMEAFIDIAQTKRVEIPQYTTFSGISGDVHLTGSVTPFLHQQLQFRLPFGADAAQVYTEVIAVEHDGGNDFYNTTIVGQDTVGAPDGLFTADLYIAGIADPQRFASVAFHTNSRYATELALDLSTRYLTVVNDSLMSGLPSQRMRTTYLSPAGAVMRFGESPVFILNRSFNNSFGPSIHFDPIFFGGLSESRYSDYSGGTYTIRNAAGAVLKEGALDDFPRSPFEAEPAKYSLTLRSEGYRIGKTMGTITLRNEVDLTKEVPDAPMFTTLRIVNGQQRATSVLTKNEAATLQFSASVPSFPRQLPVHDSTTVAIRRFGSSVWTSLPVQVAGSDADREGAVYSVQLTAATGTDSSAYELKVRVADASGNAAEQVLSPAFTVGVWNGNGPAHVREPEGRVPMQFSLEQNFPNPFNPSTTIPYRIPAAGRVVLTLHDVLGRTIRTVVEEEQAAGEHQVRLESAGLASGVYICRIEFGGQRLSRRMLLLK